MISAVETDKTPVVLDHVTVTLDGVTIHHDISLKIHSGEIVVVLGPSGTGKTILLKLIIGLLMPTYGKVLINGKSTDGMSEEELTEARLHIGMLFQGAALFDSLSVFDNIAFALRQRKQHSPQHINQIVNETLDVVGLSGTQSKFPTELSGGQKKRVGLARALATSPEVILFDEPTTGLDPTSRKRIDNLIVKLKEEKKITSIVVTHDIESAKSIATRLILLGNKTILADGKAEKLWLNNNLIRSFAEGNWHQTDSANLLKTHFN
jgi:phospholipid/cholesterol/gamma-HCH transport system ATP-binding protein